MLDTLFNVLTGKEKVQKRVTVVIDSIPSTEHQERNEDASFQLPEQQCFGVFDGMTHEGGGDTASTIARETCVAILEQTLKRNTEIKGIRYAIEQALRTANLKIQQESTSLKKIIGTTACIGCIYIDSATKKRKLIVGNAGDSGMYLFRKRESRLIKLTIDDTEALENIPTDIDKKRLQLKLAEAQSSNELTQNEKTAFARSSILTNYLGREKLVVHFTDCELETDDIVFSCSDGVSDNLTQTEIRDFLEKGSQTPSLCVRAITKAAQQRSREKGFRSKTDDMTAIIVG